MASLETPVFVTQRCDAHLPLVLLLRLPHDLLDNLLLLDEERAHNTVLDAVGTTRSTVRTLDGLLRAGDGGVFAWAEGRDLQFGRLVCVLRSSLPFQVRFGYWGPASKIYRVCWLCRRGRDEERHTPANLEPQSPHFGLVPFFFMCKYLCSPPGVLMMRTLFETVLYGMRLRCPFVSLLLSPASLSYRIEGMNGGGVRR